MSIKIPPAALEAGAKALCGTDGAYCHKACFTCTIFARAACRAMLTAWPGMWTAGDTGRNTIEQIILPLPQEASDE